MKFTVETITEWRNHLAISDIGNTAKQVFLILNDFNQFKLDAATRFQILEILRPPIQFICQSLKKHYLHQKNPLSKQQIIIARLAETLQLEMMRGYKIILENHDSKESTVSNDELGLSITRVAQYSYHTITRNYALYEMAPQHFWLELYTLYHYADKKIF